MKWFFWPTVAVLTCVAVGFFFAASKGAWKREMPLVDPVGVRSVAGGVLVLEDGREFRPAGVEPRVDVETWDLFLRVSTAQGVVVDRALGDESAAIRVEPRFYNWCGTSSRRWPGSYVQCGLAVLAVRCGYADPAQELGELSDLEVRRLKGAMALRFDDEPVLIHDELNAFRFDSLVFELQDLDGYVEALTGVDLP